LGGRGEDGGGETWAWMGVGGGEGGGFVKGEGAVGVRPLMGSASHEVGLPNTYLPTVQAVKAVGPPTQHWHLPNVGKTAAGAGTDPIYIEGLSWPTGKCAARHLPNRAAGGRLGNGKGAHGLALLPNCQLTPRDVPFQILHYF